VGQSRLVYGLAQAAPKKEAHKSKKSTFSSSKARVDRAVRLVALPVSLCVYVRVCECVCVFRFNFVEDWRGNKQDTTRRLKGLQELPYFPGGGGPLP
jgi:hypothetical protein